MAAPQRLLQVLAKEDAGVSWNSKFDLAEFLKPMMPVKLRRLETARLDDGFLASTPDGFLLNRHKKL
jgi:hypothetical protein